LGTLSPSRKPPARPRPPEALNAQHVLDDFDCGNDSLDAWLKRRAMKNYASGASRTYVVCYGKHVVAYFSLATGAIQCVNVPGRIRRNMPDPIPVMILGRLAVHLDWQKKGLGGDLLADAVKRTLQAAGISGIRAIVDHALSEEAKRFYEHFGFQSFPIDPLDLMMTLKDAQAHLV